jgi:hypothetical protein
MSQRERIDQNAPRPSPHMLVWGSFLLWLAAALFIGATGLLDRAPVPPPAVAFGLTVLGLLLLWLSPSVRSRVRAIGLRPLVAFHLVRVAAGVIFLVLYRRGVLPAEFAIPAGWGDILVGLTAIIVLWLCLPVRTPSRRLGLLAWNAIGLLDILLVLFNGVRLLSRDPALAEPFTVLPLAVLPTFVVPLVLITHVLLFAWAHERKGPPA